MTSEVRLSLAFGTPLWHFWHFWHSTPSPSPLCQKRVATLSFPSRSSSIFSPRWLPVFSAVCELPFSFAALVGGQSEAQPSSEPSKSNARNTKFRGFTYKYILEIVLPSQCVSGPPLVPDRQGRSNGKRGTNPNQRGLFFLSFFAHKHFVFPLGGCSSFCKNSAIAGGKL